ncbi:MAG: DUF3368 domain-containing protein [Cyclobacteriaceae bacterium]
MSKRKGYMPALKPLLHQLTQEAGFSISAGLFQRVLQEVGE